MHALALDPMDAAEDWRGPAQGEADYCSREGALALKAKIEAYWRDRGHNVMIALQNVGFHPALRAARYDVRSDMVNGQPRAGAGAQAGPREVFLDDFEQEGGDLVFE